MRIESFNCATSLMLLFLFVCGQLGVGDFADHNRLKLWTLDGDVNITAVAAGGSSLCVRFFFPLFCVLCDVDLLLADFH